MAYETHDKPQAIRWHLREATRVQHEALDAVASGFSLTDPAGYRHFLRAHARALPGLEAALTAAGIMELVPDWPQRSRCAALEADLALLGEDMPPAAPADLPPGPGAALGAAYVLEGSRFGNGMLLRQVRHGGDPRHNAATAYLSHQAAWPAFLEQLEAHLSDPSSWSQAASGARAAFRHFQTCMLTELAGEHAAHV